MPYVGQIVHYIDDTPQCRAAIVAAVFDPVLNPPPDPWMLPSVDGEEWVSLGVISQEGLRLRDVQHNETDKTTGTWHELETP